ncbi:MAG: signal peptidase II [candidate division Zixibacteria bacterium]|nr:signal peptidase II [candidate division Zixibacteria bacterium]MBU1470951.1 signal peptidase II [candidate division Zixibacteria bacterium]MBU2625466.1 signal peptidase II [candidate division Zixibacteria bacterium]
MTGLGSDALSRDRRSNRYILLLLSVSLLLLLLDILTKYLIQSNFVPGESLSIFGDTVRLTYVLNPKGAFGVSVGSNTFHIVTSFVVIAVVVYVFWRGLGASRLVDLSLAAILSGAIGNLIDRIRLGTVVDFADIDVPDIDFVGLYMTRWPVFNVADAAISVGMAIIILSLVFSRQHGNSPESDLERGAGTESP